MFSLDRVVNEAREAIEFFPDRKLSIMAEASKHVRPEKLGIFVARVLGVQPLDDAQAANILSSLLAARAGLLEIPPFRPFAPESVAHAAAMLGRAASGKPKNYSAQERLRRREQLAEARKKRWPK